MFIHSTMYLLKKSKHTYLIMFTGSEERLKEKLIEIDKKSNFPFPLPSIEAFETISSSTIASPISTMDNLCSSKLVNNRITSLESKRSSFGISVSKKGNKTSVGTTKLKSCSGISSSNSLDEDHKTSLNESPESSDSRLNLVDNSIESTLSTRHESGRGDESQKQWNINNLLEEENTIGCGLLDNSRKPTAAIQPKTIISSTLVLQSMATLETDRGNGCEITDSSTLSSVTQTQSSHQSNVVSSLALISGDYGSGSSSAEDD